MREDLYWIKLAVSAGLIAGFGLSPKLWLSSRFYPLTPVFEWLHPIPPPFDRVVLIALILIGGYVALDHRPAKAIAAWIVLAAAYGMYDQSRWQPWFYQYLCMLAALSVAYASKDPQGARDSALSACRWMVAGIYFWSGLHKINFGFVHNAFPWMVEPFARWLPAHARGWLNPLAVAVPVTEAAMAIGLVTKRFRRPAVIAAIAMHAWILASIGPLGHNFDNVVWPWNIAMMCLVVLLFWREEAALGGARLVPKAALLLFGFAPALSFLNLWDGYMSFSLYSGSSNRAQMYMSDRVAGKLPDEIQEQIGVNDSMVDQLDIMNWSYAELNVPAYSELRVYKNIGRTVCAQAGNPIDMALVVQLKSNLLQRQRQQVYSCENLSHR